MIEIVRDLSIPKNWDRRGLPGWTYHSDALLELEKQHLFREHWQIACHVSDLPEPGNYLTLDVVGERALILRDEDGQIRGFHNICKHRGSRLVADERGKCRNALVCPFHGWVYNLDGTLRGPSRPNSFPPLDKFEFGVMPKRLLVGSTMRPSGVIVAPNAPSRIEVPVLSAKSRMARANGSGSCCGKRGTAVSGVTIRSAGFSVIIF